MQKTSRFANKVWNLYKNMDNDTFLYMQRVRPSKNLLTKTKKANWPEWQSTAGSIQPGWVRFVDSK